MFTKNELKPKLLTSTYILMYYLSNTFNFQNFKNCLPDNVEGKNFMIGWSRSNPDLKVLWVKVNCTKKLEILDRNSLFREMTLTLNPVTLDLTDAR